MTAPTSARARVEVEVSLCAGTGMCESVAPGLFEIDDDGALQLLHPELADEQVEWARKAARACPTRALRVV